MKKQIKKCVAMFLIAAILFSGIESISVRATSTSTIDESTGHMTTTWDFADADDADDFTFYTTNYHGESEYTIEGGQLNSGYENLDSSHSKRFSVHKKALLNDSYGGKISRLSVDISPVGDSGVMDACVYLGVNPGVDGTISAEATKATDGISIRYRDVASGNTCQEILVDLYHGGTSYRLLEKIDNSANGDVIAGLGESNLAETVTMTIETIADKTIQLTVAIKEDVTKCVTYTIDVSKNKSDEEIGFDSTILEGQVGLGAWYRGACFDNFSITYSPVEYDFDNAGQKYSFDFYEHKDGNGTGTMTIADGCLSSAIVDVTGTGYNRKVILKNDYAAVQSAAVDFVPAKDAEGMRGCMYFNVIGGQKSTNGGSITDSDTGEVTAVDCVRTDVTGYYTGINGMVFQLTDKDTWESHSILLKVEYIFYDANAKKTVTYTYKNPDTESAEITWKPDWYRETGEAEALTMTVEKITNDLYQCTISQKSNPNNYVQTTVDLNNFCDGDANAADVIPDYDKSGTIGLGTWTYNDSNTSTPAQFDNLIVDGTPVTVGGMEDSKVVVSRYRSLPTGADVVDGKYILGWTMNATSDDGTSVASSVRTYYGTGDGNLTYTYEANVVDPAMLTVSFQEAVSEEGEACYDVRFAAALNDFDFADYKRAGFVFSKDETAELVVDAEKCMTRSTTRLYASLNANSESVTPGEIYISDNDYAEYFFAREIIGIPSGETVYVRAFLELSNGYIVYGEPTSITVPYTEAQ